MPPAKPIPLEKLTVKRVQKSLTNFTVNGNNCWLWLGGKNKGYGRMKIANKYYMVYRVMYALVHGDPPSNLVCDHICREPACINPGHLDVVTAEENFRRGDNHNKLMTHCKRGHSLKDCYYQNGGKRYCKPCKLLRDKLKYQKVRRPGGERNKMA